MKRLFFFLMALVLISPLYARQALSEEARISILTSAPYDAAVFTVYGHAALRVNDPQQELDIIFNYGIFDFTKPNFIFRFVKGETDYKLGVADYLSYIIEYQMRGSDVTEQVLDLLPEEKERLFNALLINNRPENRVYRYNFFFDNCATRLPALIEEYVRGEVVYHHPPEPKTFRELINYCTRKQPWLTFGCDIVVGCPADRLITPHEMMFLPSYVERELGNATVRRTDGTERPLVEATHVVEASGEEDEAFQGIGSVLTPMVCAWGVFFLVAALTYREWRRKRYYKAVDCVLFMMAGLAGVIVFFLSFFSSHPCMWPNWNLIWLHPLHGVAAILFCVKKAERAAYYYHFINFAALTLMLLGWYFIPQYLNMAFIPLVATLWLRSGYGIYRYKQKIG